MQYPAILNNGGIGPHRYHQFDQICIAVWERTQGDMEVMEAVARATYHPLRGYLIHGLKSIVSAHLRADVIGKLDPTLLEIAQGQSLEADRAKKLIKDLTPSQATWDYIVSAGDVLRPKNVPPPINTETMTPEQIARTIAQTPWIVLPTIAGSDEEKYDLTKTVYFYGVAPEPIEWNGESEDEPRELRIRDMVRLINFEELHRGELRKEAGKNRIRAVPNWLTTAMAGGPSPGSRPEWIDADDAPSDGYYWSFQFENPEIKRIVAAQRTPGKQSDVIVAILDTSPDRDAISKLLAAPGTPQGIKDNKLLQNVSAAQSKGSIIIDDPADLSIPEDEFNMLGGGVKVDWANLGPPGITAASSGTATKGTSPDPFKMDDHGLFVTGIIHDIAPNAETHLIRAVGGYGVSDIDHVLKVMKHLPKLIEKDATKQLVVNMSLGFSIPPGVEVLHLWLEETFKEMAADFGKSNDLDSALTALATNNPVVVAELNEILADLKIGVDEMTAFISQNDRILVVAAAGNDNRAFPSRHDNRYRPEPRWPARDDKVLGVAAVDLNNDPTTYSNRGDVTQMGNGIATFGGNTSVKANEIIGEIDTDEDGNGILGMAKGFLRKVRRRLFGRAKTGVNWGDFMEDTVDAVRGIYISPDLTMGTNPSLTNETGWVYWSGTSFATPVIAALAADHWDQYQKEDPQGAWLNRQTVINKIVGLQSKGSDGKGTDTLDCPIIFARQEPVK